MTRETEETMSINDQAARWWVLLQDRDATTADRREFAEWTVQGPDRVEAMLRVARLHKALAQPGMRWSTISVEQLIREAKGASEEVVLPMPGRRPPPSRQLVRRPAVSVALGMAASAVVMLWLSRAFFRHALRSYRSASS